MKADLLVYAKNWISALAKDYQVKEKNLNIINVL